MCTQVQEIINNADKLMNSSVKTLSLQLSSINTGRPHPNILSDIKIDYYGSYIFINQVSNITVVDNTNLSIDPWEKDLLPKIEKSIIQSNLGLNPKNLGDRLLIPIPALNKERRLSMVKLVKSKSEQTKINIRNIRRTANTKIKNLLKDKDISKDDVLKAEIKIQHLTDNVINKINFNDISKDFYYDYISYGQKLGYSRNYIGSIMQKLKTIIQSAYDEDVHANVEFKKKYFRKFIEEVNHPYLSNHEIQSLYKLEINSEYLDAIRDIFIIDCYTGLRIGDLMSFLKKPKIELFNGRKHIHIIQHKTKKPVFIPLKQIIIDILNKRNGNFPPYIHQNKINKEIKPLLRKCGILELYSIEKTIGGKLISESIPKYKLISCHSARRSFCSNAYNSGASTRYYGLLWT